MHASLLCLAKDRNINRQEVTLGERVNVATTRKEESKHIFSEAKGVDEATTNVAGCFEEGLLTAFISTKVDEGVLGDDALRSKHSVCQVGQLLCTSDGVKAAGVTRTLGTLGREVVIIAGCNCKGGGDSKDGSSDSRTHGVDRINGDVLMLIDEVICIMSSLRWKNEGSHEVD